MMAEVIVGMPMRAATVTAHAIALLCARYQDVHRQAGIPMMERLIADMPMAAVTVTIVVNRLQIHVAAGREDITDITGKSVGE